MHTSEQSKIKHGIKLLTIIVLAAAMIIPLVAYATTAQEHPREQRSVLMKSISDKAMDAIDIAAAEAEKAEAERAAEEQRLAEEAAAQAAQAALEAEQQQEATYDYDYYEPAYTADYSAYENGSGLTMSGGVNYYDGRRETWYSSNVLYHYRTSEWTVDDEGFYRDDEGRYVVAASDKKPGETFQGSKGECIVLDAGCAAGTTDYYVAW